MTRGKKSLKASSEGIKRANTVLTFVSKDLASELAISHAIVQKFFAGKLIGRKAFYKICQRLELPWQEVADLSEETELDQELLNRDKGKDLNTLVQEVRQKIHASIQEKCGMMRLLDISQPIGLNDIYTNVNILEKISGRRRLEIADLLKVSTIDEFERPGFGKIVQDRVPALEAVQKYSKLMILGKPGSGKTTFLKYVAIQCNLGKFQTHLVPIFITFKEFAETEQHPNLVEYVIGQFLNYGVTDTVATELLLQGKMLILLDGLDEVKLADSKRVLEEIYNFFAQFPDNHFVVSCRLAAKEYTLVQFTEVEIADFDNDQIATFANKWFQAKDPAKTEKFIQKLHQNSPIQELAICPLLLTMLCLLFEELADFPANRADIYQEGLNVLLRKWDAKRNIEREKIYKKLNVQHKEDLLSQIALTTFERGDYFFNQPELEQFVKDYIYNIGDVSTEPEMLQLDSEALIKSIEAQHGLLVERAKGIYSFSHLTFHEYFTAREIVASSEPQVLEQALKHLVSRITQKRWREVFLLTVVMLRNANYLLRLMKQQIDDLIASDPYLQEFLIWVSHKSRVVTSPYKPWAMRAFYLDLTLALDLTLVGGNIALDLALAMANGIDLNLTFDLSLPSGKLAIALALALNRALTLNIVLEFARTLALDLALDPELDSSLRQLKQLPEPCRDRAKFKEWWQTKGQPWTDELKAVMISLHNLGGNWQFSNQQREALRQYYGANQLLVDCLSSDCYVTRSVREEIEATLLLPSAEIS